MALQSLQKVEQNSTSSNRCETEKASVHTHHKNGGTTRFIRFATCIATPLRHKLQEKLRRL